MMSKPRTRLYNSGDLTKDEKYFTRFFEYVKDQFSDPRYEIYIINEDFGRSIGTGIKDNNKGTEYPPGVIVWFQYGGSRIQNPVTESIIKEVRKCLELEIKYEFNKILKRFPEVNREI